MNYGRLIIFIFFTLASYKAFLITLGVILSFGSTENNAYEFITWLTRIWFFISTYAWVAYFSMAWYWIRNKNINLIYMKSGYIAGVFSALMVIFSPLSFAIVYALPAIVLASILLIFHKNKALIEHA